MIDFDALEDLPEEVFGNEDLIAYLAGFFDGEGCVHASERGEGDRGTATLLIVSNTDPRPLKLFKAVFGGSIQKRIDKRGNRKPSYNLVIAGSQAGDAAMRLLPHAIVKHEKLQAFIDLRNCMRNTGAAGYTVDELNNRNEALKALREI